MKKDQLLNQIIARLKTELQLITEAAQNTYDIATHEENKAENEYDTRGLEASYLAGAQAERVFEMKETIAILEVIKVKDFKSTDVISFSALIELEHLNKKQIVFLLPRAGGVKIHFEGKDIQVVTPDSPLGEALVGLSEGDVATIDAGQRTKDYEILKVY